MKKSQKSNTNLPQRRMFLETLEDRRLLAGVPELAGIQTNNGDLLSDGDVLHAAPQEIVLNFNQDAEIDPASLNSVTILRSGGDDSFNHASATSHFDTGGVVDIVFTAKAGGVVGNGIEIVVSKSDHNNASGPTIVVDVDGATVLVDLNTNVGNETTANLLVDAINDDDAASGLIEASLGGGDGATDITAAATDYSPIVLSGSNDEVIEAGYIGVDESARQIVFRFREALTADAYQVSVRGTGESTLSDLDGSVFLDGAGDFTRNFKLSLGPQIEAVVPQPVMRDPVSRELEQLKDTIHVYFNEQNLDSSRAEDKEFYPLIFTNDTVENTDDVVFLPTEVEYKPDSDLVVLTYASDLDELAGAGDGTFRLRIGDKEYQDNNRLPFTPIKLNLSDSDVAATYDTATAIGKTMSVSGNGGDAVDGTGFTITDVDSGDTSFEFDGGIILQIPSGSSDDILIGDIVHIADGPDPNDAKHFEFVTDFNAAAPGNIPIVYDVNNSAEEMAGLVVDAIASTELDVAITVLSAGEIHLGWNPELVVVIDSGTDEITREGDTIVGSGARRVLVINRESFDASNVAAAISSSINDAGNSKLRASREGTEDGDSRIALVGVEAVTESPVFNVAVFESLIVQGTIGDDDFDPRTAIRNPGAEDEPGHRDIRVQDHLLVTGAYLTVPAGGFQDGDLIEVTNGLQNTVFEFDNNGELSNPSNFPIIFAGIPTPHQFATIIATVLSENEFNDESGSPSVYSGSNLGDGVILVLLAEGYNFLGLDTGLVVEDAPAARGGTTTLDYSFPALYGTDPLGNNLLNAITENQKQRAREIFEMYGQALGLTFVETDAAGLKVITGDMRAIDPTVSIGIGSPFGLGEFGGDTGRAIMDLQDFQDAEDDEYGGPWFNTAFHEIGHLLGLGHTDGLAPFTVMNSDDDLGFGQAIESRFPGDHDVSHGQFLYGVRTGDLDLYEIDITEAGTLDIETFAERLADVSLLDTAVSVFRDVSILDASGSNTIVGKELVARNDDYFSEDSSLTIDVTEGHYYIGVSSTGNDSDNPAVEGTGQGGKTQGHYELRLVFSKTADDYITDDSDESVGLDADGDGTPGGTLNTWFNVTETDGIPGVNESRTVFVDKSSDPSGNGSIASPFSNLNTAMAVAEPGDIVRVIGNAGADGDAATLQDNQAYELGYNPLSGADLPDGDSLVVKQGVTLMVDAGVVIKSRRARIARGSDSSLINLSGSAIQMLGTPRLLDSNGNLLTDANGDSVPGEIYLTSLFDKEIGLHTTAGTGVFEATGGDWGGIDLRDSVDAQRVSVVLDSEKGEFVDLINHVTIQYGGGSVVVGGSVEVISPIQLDDVLPTITHNTIRNNASAAIAATPNSFLETRFNESKYQDVSFTPDYSRVGPEVFGNTIVDNSINGMLLRINTPSGAGVNELDVAARFDDTDIVHVITENLILDHGVGGPVQTGVDDDGKRILAARYDSSLVIDPGTVVKFNAARIDMKVGTLLLAEGNQNHDVVLTSVRDTRYGAGGTFDTTNQGGSVVASPGDWSGVFASPFSNLSVDHAVVAYGGGVSRIEGTFAAFNAIEVRDANARITRTHLEYNESGFRPQDADRNGRGLNGDAVIFVSGDQPVIADNTIQHNLAFAISMGVNDLNYEFVQDAGRQTSHANPIEGRVGNQGPLVQDNIIGDNALNAMLVRGGTLTTEGVWDDTDIVHVVVNSIHVPDFHTYGGLRLESSPRESLVVKLADFDANNPAGFTANGKPLDIDDRIGGSINIVGQPHYPVVLTSLADDTVGAGYTPGGQLQTDTANDATDLGGSGGGGGTTSQTSTEILINLGDGIQKGSALDLAAQEAKELWESILHDPVSLSLDMNTEALGANVAGYMISTTSIGEIAYDDVRSAMIADGTTAEKTLLNQLPTFAQLNTVGGTAEDTILISQANAKALESLDISGVTFNRSGKCWTACDGYFAIEETYDFTSPGIIQLITHEIGHALGYIGGPPISHGNLTPLDMFRLEPGTGAADFTSAPRVMDEGRDNVFYDGVYDPAAITNPTGLDVGDIPMSDGTDNPDGDGYQTSHYKGRYVNGPTRETGTYIGVMDPVNDPDPEINGTPIVLDSDKSVLGLIGWDIETDDGGGGGGGIGNTPSPGDWDGINLLQYSNDRNLAFINERESDDHSQRIYENFDPASSQFVGQLAAHQFAGDELARLGFEIQGTIETPTDEDMYRFEAAAGTEIWLDIDRTEAQLDTVIELLDSAGRVMYRSDNSGDASTIETNPNGDSSLTLSTFAQPLKKSVFSVFDNGTTNKKDAGMRLLLPGAVGQIHTYHVRVLSADQLVGGSYQLQVRLQELDEEPGSSIQFADIRYATAGVEIVGLPAHSPLAGEVVEVEPGNDVLGGAQSLGNLLQTDRAVVSIAGNLGTSNDVDFYEFNVSYEDVDVPPDDEGTGMAAVFDVDYADGFARANTNISIFKDGQLILFGSDSNIADDRPAPLQGANLDDLSRGTIGPLDPFVGTVELPVGNYAVAVTNETRIPSQMDQFFEKFPTNFGLRVEPINSIDRIVEERFDGTSQFIEDSNIVPYFLGDVVLFVSADVGGLNTSILTIDGFTGKQETLIKDRIGYDVQDVALRPDNHSMYGFTVVNPSGFGGPDDRVGNYLEISTGDGSIMNADPVTGALLDDGVFTFQDDGLGAATPSDHGIHYDAIVFGRPQGSSLEGFAVGHRPVNPVPVFPPGTKPLLEDRKNILYHFDPNTGEALSDPDDDRQDIGTLEGAATNIVERGVLDTTSPLAATRRKLLLAPEATLYNSLTDTTVAKIADGTSFFIDDDNIPGTPSKEFEFNGGPEIFFNMDPENGLFLRDGDVFNLDSLEFEFNTGPILNVEALSGSEFDDGDTFRITDVGNTTKTFEFDDDDDVLGGHEAVTFINTMTQSEVVAAVVSAINGAEFFATAIPLAPDSGRITLTQDSLFIRPQSGLSGLSVEGEHGSVGAGTLIQIEETNGNFQFGQNMAAAFSSIPSIEMGLDGRRINFLNAITGSFTAAVNRTVFEDRNGNGTTTLDASGNSSRIPVPFLAQDTANEIAARIRLALNTNGIAADVTESVVLLTGNARVSGADFPLRVAGEAPGGEITGMAFLGTTLYAVCDNGGLYRIDNPLAPIVGDSAVAVYIPSSASDLQGKSFQGLAAGPTTTEDGKYADMLFAIDDEGVIYAFDTTGVFQPVFVDGTSSVETGIANANGLDFSTIVENPWSLSTGSGRSPNSGHGRLDSYDGTQIDEAGGNSLHFGFGNNPPANFPGGTHGTVETGEFSLLGYSAADKPTLYFNYFLETEDAVGIRSEDGSVVPMMDSFRVFVGDDSGTWVLLGTNNHFDDVEDDPGIVCDAQNPPLGCDELDLYPANHKVQVQKLFDNTDNWRQARVDLSPFAGSSHLKLRFDFSSAGDTNTGDLLTTGTELRVGAPADLRDGDVFSVDSNDLEFDMGFTLITPTGAAMEEGGSITINYGFNITTQLTIDKSNPESLPGMIAINDDMTAREVAEAVDTAINENLPRQTLNNDLGGFAEPNELLTTATVINFNGLSGTYNSFQAEIGDNTELIGNLPADVDLLSVELAAGTTIRVDTDTDAYSNVLNTVARLFDANGVELAISHDDIAPGEAPGTDSYFEFVVASDGEYFIGISGLGNSTYDPADDVTPRPGGSTGRYNLTIDADVAAGFTQLQGNRINLPAPEIVVNDTAMILEGAVGVNPGNIPVSIHSGMTSSEVALRIQAALANTFSDGVLEAFKHHDSMLRLIGHTLTERGPLGLTDRMPADEYGDFESERRGQDAAAGETTFSSFEGVYIDDIIVGLAERGEMVTGATQFDTSFGDNARPLPDQIKTGHYQLEVRRATQYIDYNEFDEAAVKRTWDSNDRLGNKLSIRANAGLDIVEGTTFTLHDGYSNHIVTFEFDDKNIDDGVGFGHIEISLDPSESAENIALFIRDAINTNLILHDAGIIAAGSYTPS